MSAVIGQWWRLWRWYGRNTKMVAAVGESLDSMTSAFYYSLDRCLEERASGRDFGECVEEEVEWLIGSIEYEFILVTAHDLG
jgi:hypothetical protein